MYGNTGVFDDCAALCLEESATQCPTMHVVECCCILIINYCWHPSTPSLASGLRQMTSFVKIFRSVGVERLAPQACSFVVGAFWCHSRTYFLCARAVLRRTRGAGV